MAGALRPRVRARAPARVRARAAFVRDALNRAWHAQGAGARPDPTVRPRRRRHAHATRRLRALSRLGTPCASSQRPHPPAAPP
eukprot:5330200-Prymnesium_polylepis.1